MEYKILNKEAFFIREGEKSSIVMIKETSEQFILNTSGFFIFETVLANDNTNAVLDELCAKYDGMDRKILENDLLSILRMMKIYKIVSYDEEFKHTESREDKVSCVCEDEYVTIADFLEQSNREKNFLAGFPGYYTPANIRAHIMNNQEFYYASKKGDGCYNGAIVVVPNVNNTSVLNVTALTFEENMSEMEIIKCGRELIKYVKNSMINKVNKLRISFYGKPNTEPVFLNQFKKLGFKMEAELKNEHNEQSLFMYSLNCVS